MTQQHSDHSVNINSEQTSTNASIAQVTPSQLQEFVPFDQFSEHHLIELCKHAKIETLPADSLIFQRKAKLSHKYYLLKGSIDLCNQNFEIQTITSTLDEIYVNPLNSEMTASCAAISTSQVQVLKIDNAPLDLILIQANGPQVDNLQDNETLDDEPAIFDWMSDLLQSKLLQRVPPSNIQQLFKSFEPVNFHKGQVVITENDHGEHLYVLTQGIAEVTKVDVYGSPTFVAKLMPGQFFGQEALISDSPRNASVTMITHGSCMQLNKSTFTQLLQEPVIQTINEEEYLAMQATNENLRILDLRNWDEVTDEPLENSTHIPFTELRQRMSELDDQLTYITHKNNGRRAELGAYLLNEAGYSAFILR